MHVNLSLHRGRRFHVPFTQLHGCDQILVTIMRIKPRIRFTFGFARFPSLNSLLNLKLRDLSTITGILPWNLALNIQILIRFKFAI